MCWKKFPNEAEKSTKNKVINIKKDSADIALSYTNRSMSVLGLNILSSICISEYVCKDKFLNIRSIITDKLPNIKEEILYHEDLTDNGKLLFLYALKYLNDNEILKKYLTKDVFYENIIINSIFTNQFQKNEKPIQDILNEEDISKKALLLRYLSLNLDRNLTVDETRKLLKDLFFFSRFQKK